ncbi:hypothetical protein [uncultured Dokdonia sp.]|nr:hypothetical protein [uncultured Dokdonia sp.]
MTNQVAKQLQENKRSNYGRSYYKVADVCDVRKHVENKKGKISQIFK